MFTGIVQAVGKVESLQEGVLKVSVPATFSDEGFQVGESIAVSGCCLTVIPTSTETLLQFDLSPETLNRTSLSQLAASSGVNLERAMKADSRFGGHVVQGHVDATGEVVSITKADNAFIYRFRVPEDAQRYLIDKGSITIDGISLTVVEPEGREFNVWVIPHTLEETNLGDRKVGDKVNLEFDVLAKHVEKLLLTYLEKLLPQHLNTLQHSEQPAIEGR